MIDLEIKLFGAFRSFDNGVPLIVSLAPGSSLATLRQALLPTLLARQPGSDPQPLLESAAFADEEQVLAQDYRLERSMQLAVLPPVCGG